MKTPRVGKSCEDFLAPELDRLPGLTIASRNGAVVPLSQIARLDYEYEEPIMWRRAALLRVPHRPFGRP